MAVATAGMLVLAGVYQFVLTPLGERRERVKIDVAAARADFGRAERQVQAARRLDQRWGEMLSAGLSADASRAEGQALRALRDWAQDAGLSLSSLKPERTEQRKQFLEITLRATGAGSMRSVGQFLARVRTATIPVRVTDLTISARKEGTDELSVQLGVSTICLAPEPRKPRPAAGAAGAASTSADWEASR